jgi:uracil phosphoribosyltransferase
VQVEVLDHPIVASQLSELRALDTPNPRFRTLVSDITRALVFHAARPLPTREIPVTTPMGTTVGVSLASQPLLVPILRAGLGMLPSALDVLPESPTGFVGLRRNEETLTPVVYMNTIPQLNGEPVFLLDPMLATGGSAQAAADIIQTAGAGPITLVSLLAAPDGIAALAQSGTVTRLVTAAIDDHLNDVGYIVPGLGDAGDRQFGDQ